MVGACRAPTNFLKQCKAEALPYLFFLLSKGGNKLRPYATLWSALTMSMQLN
jgi:hypothetical protein